MQFWAGRKAAFPAVGRISPDYMCMDGTIPRHQLANVLGRITELPVIMGFGWRMFFMPRRDLHPLILFDANKTGEWKLQAFGADILKLCVEVGGVLTGEHGVGIESVIDAVMFDEIDLNHQKIEMHSIQKAP